MRYKKAKKTLLNTCIFVSIGALFGSINMLLDRLANHLRWIVYSHMEYENNK